MRNFLWRLPVFSIGSPPRNLASLLCISIHFPLSWEVRLTRKKELDKEMKSVWTVFCGAPGCSDDNGKLCCADFGSIADPSSCINHVLIICFDVVLLLIFLCNLFCKASLRATNIPARFHGFSRLQLISAIFNGFLGLAYLAVGIWILEDKLMKKGKKKTLEDEDIPGLSEADRAESCYLIFEELLNKQKQVDPSSQPSVLKTILICHRKEIIVSGFFALLRVITVSAGPLLLNAFIKVVEGNASFRNEGLFLAIFLFTSKSLESLSQRQWYFRCRLIGLKVRSLLTAAIYRKQIRLSNASKLMHSSGEIMNYVTVDAYQIGEFPFWLHQTWTTTIQICLVLIILFRIVGLATIASLAVIILTVLCNTPLAKLQHKFQTRLMVAQDDRLKAISEALVSMKVLRLYAWEARFKNVIHSLRQIEEKWLSAVQSRRSYNSFLFWSSPVLVSAATFGTCYFLGIPLSASNVFTFVATLRLVQDPVRTIPDVIGVVIQAKVSFERIVKFLEASELEMTNLRRNTSEAQIMLYSSNQLLSHGKRIHRDQHSETLIWRLNLVRRLLYVEKLARESQLFCQQFWERFQVYKEQFKYMEQLPTSLNQHGFRQVQYERIFCSVLHWIAKDTSKPWRNVHC